MVRAIRQKLFCHRARRRNCGACRFGSRGSRERFGGLGSWKRQSMSGWRRSWSSMRISLARAKKTAAVLLEVVLALVLIAAAAAVIGGGLSVSIDRVQLLKLNAHASDLAISVMSELQMGTKVLSPEGPEAFEAPFE